MDEEACLRRYGLRPAGADLDEVRVLLGEHAARERRAQGEGDTILMRLCCVQLFNSGALDDVLLIWDAKRSSFDAACSIDVEVLLGHGLDATKAHLSAHPTPSAAAALHRLRELETAGVFEDFSVEEFSASCDEYYAG
ncbi:MULTISPECIES: hypothetical protein [unclassified Streptomyces]|uniref:hypothetical protein n=1 Tax=unclassified Streptomyces TaxID=2593676 RepID=UPI000747F8F6|nr:MULTISPECIES: hypothetical protein [unclassified Streptomyces]KUL70635.1 hypothetical protein ADL34_27140 [Streptomyces sp. NRRL WC-3605]KUL80315.1 hypothetical protein ADL33_03655 [Streptomyces sp. NRRL WC-3604]